MILKSIQDPLDPLLSDFRYWVIHYLHSCNKSSNAEGRKGCYEPHVGSDMI